MSGGLRAANRASIPSGYGSRLMSLTAIDGFAFSKALTVAFTAASSAPVAFQWANVIVVLCCTAGPPATLVLAIVAPALSPTTRPTLARTTPKRSHH